MTNDQEALLQDARDELLKAGPEIKKLERRIVRAERTIEIALRAPVGCSGVDVPGGDETTTQSTPCRSTGAERKRN